MERCIIIAAGCVHPDSAALAKLTGEEYILCADGGYDRALQLKLRPHAVIGDMDSVSAKIPPEVECIRRPARKDETDLQLAVELALERGHTDLLLLGITGGRTDHLLGNMQLLGRIAQRIGCVKAIGHDGIYHALCNGEIILTGAPDAVFSLLSLSDTSRGVFIEGGAYPLSDATLHNTVPLGVSNRFGASGSVKIRVREGIVLLICPQKK